MVKIWINWIKWVEQVKKFTPMQINTMINQVKNLVIIIGVQMELIVQEFANVGFTLLVFVLACVLVNKFKGDIDD